MSAGGVLANDSDADSDPLTAVLVGGPAHAADFTLNADGSFTYTPELNYFGADSFTYQANDGTLNGNTVTVDLTVTTSSDTWTGAAGDNKWFTAGNWDNGVPGPDSVVIFNADANVDLTADPTIGSLDVTNGATVTLTLDPADPLLTVSGPADIDGGLNVLGGDVTFAGAVTPEYLSSIYLDVGSLTVSGAQPNGIYFDDVNWNAGQDIDISGPIGGDFAVLDGGSIASANGNITIAGSADGTVIGEIDGNFSNSGNGSIQAQLGSITVDEQVGGSFWNGSADGSYDAAAASYISANGATLAIEGSVALDFANSGGSYILNNSGDVLIDESIGGNFSNGSVGGSYNGTDYSTIWADGGNLTITGSVVGDFSNSGGGDIEAGGGSVTISEVIGGNFSNGSVGGVTDVSGNDGSFIGSIGGDVTISGSVAGSFENTAGSYIRADGGSLIISASVGGDFSNVTIDAGDSTVSSYIWASGGDVTISGDIGGTFWNSAGSYIEADQGGSFGNPPEGGALGGAANAGGNIDFSGSLGTFSNEGTISADNALTFSGAIDAGFYNYGNIDVGQLNIDAGVGQTFDNYNDIYLHGSDLSTIGVELDNLGFIDVVNGSLQLGSFHNASEIRADGYATVLLEGETTNDAGGYIYASGGTVHIDASVDNWGIIDAESDGLIVVNATITNDPGGEAQIDGGTLEFAVDSDADVSFGAISNGTLLLDAPVTYSGHVSGFTYDDKIDFSGVELEDSTVSFDQGTGALTVADGNGHMASVLLYELPDHQYQTSDFFRLDDGSGHLTVEAEPAVALTGPSNALVEAGVDQNGGPVGTDVSTAVVALENAPNNDRVSFDTSNLTPVAPDGVAAVEGPNGHYYALVAAPASPSWQADEAAAESVGGYLATITSAAENTFVENLAAGHYAYIGASDLGHTGTWNWATGPEAGTTFWIGNNASGYPVDGAFTDWRSGEPNDYLGTEHFGMLDLGGWNDVSDSYEYENSYVAEFSTFRIQGTYGYADLNTATGALTYHLDDGNHTVDALAAGDQLTDTIDVRSDHGGRRRRRREGAVHHRRQQRRADADAARYGNDHRRERAADPAHRRACVRSRQWRHADADRCRWTAAASAHSTRTCRSSTRPTVPIP